jgi:hypothetical protein
MSGCVWIKLLLHVLIVSSCCLIQSEHIDHLLDRSDDNSSLTLSDESAHQICNHGLGRLVYEKTSDHKSAIVGKQNSETIGRSGLPIKVLEECIRKCQVQNSRRCICDDLNETRFFFSSPGRQNDLN